MTYTRRELLAGAAALASAPGSHAAAPPADPVALARCASYGKELLPTLHGMFDRLGGLGRIVKGKTVAVKLNLTGSPDYRLGHLPAELAHWTHPAVIGAAVHLMGRAGARRIRLLESPWSTAEPIEEYMIDASWEPRDLLSAAPRVEFENTNWLGNAKTYTRFKVPRPYIYPAFDLNHSYADCDVFVTIAKMKEHFNAGITLAMKNSFGIAPCTIYGDGAGADEPTDVPRGGRGMFHGGRRQPPRSAPGEIVDAKAPRDGGYRVPRIVVDLVGARPIDLSIVDGIASMTHGEGPWIAGAKPVWPCVLLAGTNPVTTDAAGAAVMGFDPMAERGRAPFEKCDSTLKLAEDAGLGTRDLKRIEVRGAAIADVRFDFRKHHA
mgnify:CR=1 FL=1